MQELESWLSLKSMQGLAEEPSLDPNTHVRHLVTTYNSNSGEFNAPVSMGSYIVMCHPSSYMRIHIIFKRR